MSGEFSDEDLERIKNTYRLVPNPEDPENEDSTCIEIKDGPFDKCVLQFGKIQMQNKEGTDDVTPQYEYDIKYVPENISTTEFTDEEGEEFENMIGDILMALIYEQHKIIEEKKNAKNRDPDTLTFTI